MNKIFLYVPIEYTKKKIKITVPSKISDGFIYFFDLVRQKEDSRTYEGFQKRSITLKDYLDITKNFE